MLAGCNGASNSISERWMGGHGGLHGRQRWFDPASARWLPRRRPLTDGRCGQRDNETDEKASDQAAKRTSSVGAAISRSMAMQPFISVAPASVTVASSASSPAISAARQMQWRPWAAS